MTEGLPTIPCLVYTRKYGWIVVQPVTDARGMLRPAWAYSRPGQVRVQPGDVLAAASLPPVPENAL